MNSSDIVVTKQKKTTNVETDSALEEIQERLVNIIGPLSRIWMKDGFHK